MSGETTGCAPELDPCAPEFAVPAQYSGTSVQDEVKLTVECLAAESNSARLCGVLNCETAKGENLSLIGQIIGWPREHCNVKAAPYFGYDCQTPPPTGTGCPEISVVGLCDGAYYYCRLAEREDYIFTDDELYRSFIKAKIVKNRALNNGEAPDVSLITEIIQALWGPEAWVFEADCGVIGVTAGRNLTDEELCILELYGRVICAGPGIEVKIYCEEPAGPCDVQCPPLITQTKVGGSDFNYSSPQFINASTITVTGAPSWMAVTTSQGLSGPFFTISGTSPSGVSSTTLTVDAQPEVPGALGCSGTIQINCIEGSLLECPDDQNINCENLPVVISGFSGATGITNGPVPSGYFVSSDAAAGTVTVSGSGASGSFTIIATDGNDTCTVNVSIEGCVNEGEIIPPNNCSTSLVFANNQNGQQCQTAPAQFTGGSGTITLTATNVAAPFTFNDLGNGQWEICVASQSAGTGARSYDVIANDGVNPPVVCGPHFIEVDGL